MDTNRIVDNKSPMAAHGVVLDAADGREVFTVIVKMSWWVSARGRVEPAIPAAPIRMNTAYWPRLPERDRASPRYPSDVAVFKPGTDVLLTGTARPADDDDATERPMALRVARGEAFAVDKTLHLYGPRTWTQGTMRIAPGPAARLVPTALRWEHAFGGRDRRADRFSRYDRNPVGMGYVDNRDDLLGHPAPRLEDPAATTASRTPHAAGFGPIDVDWSPRAELAGTFDDDWKRTRRPLAPADQDPRFSCSAPHDQWCAEPLAGDEAIEVVGVLPSGPWRFRLPRYHPLLVATLFDREGEPVELRETPHLDTLLIDADEQRVELSWRAAFPLPRKSERLRRVEVLEALPLDEEMLARMRARLDEVNAA